MKRLALFFILLSAGAFCSDLRLSFFIGDCLVKQKDKTEWIKASLNMIIREGDTIRTGEDANCEITREDDVIKIEPNTTFVVKTLKEKKDVFSIFFGKVWLRIQRLKERETSVETPTAVMGLRGTIFFVDVIEKRTITDLLEGELDILAEGKSLILKAGEKFLYDKDLPFEKRIQKRPLTQDERNKFKDIFKLKELPPQASLPPQVSLPKKDVIPQAKEGLFDKFQAKEEEEDLKTEIKGIKNELSKERLSILTVKENDFQAGRTMRDIWGNLVRVEQHLYRPTNKEIRFVNINKRETNLKDTTEFNYGMISATFNKELPDDIKKWPEWIRQEVDNDSKSELHPERVETILSNGKPQDPNADRMKWESVWNSNKNELTEPKFFIDKGRDNAIGYTEYSNDWKESPSQPPKPPEGVFYEEKRFDIYDKNGSSREGELKMGLYLINNNGNQMKSDDFKDTDFFSCLENTGLEMRFESSSLLAKPIDIIFTADIILAGIREFMGSVIGALE